MKIKVEPGVVVKLDANRTTSMKGGTYEADDKYAKEAVKQDGVTDASKPAPVKETSNAD